MKTNNITKVILPLALAAILSGELCIAETAPDNSGRNVVDRDHNTVLPGDQSSQSEFMERTAKIRREILAREDLSVNAHNIKIITLDTGTVVLRGPVMSNREKMIVEQLARSVSGGAPVESFLEVKSVG